MDSSFDFRKFGKVLTFVMFVMIMTTDSQTALSKKCRWNHWNLVSELEILSTEKLLVSMGSKDEVLCESRFCLSENATTPGLVQRFLLASLSK